MSRLDQEFNSMFKEKVDIEDVDYTPIPDEDFVPAKLATHDIDEKVVIRVEL